MRLAQRLPSQMLPTGSAPTNTHRIAAVGAVASTLNSARFAARLAADSTPVLHPVSALSTGLRPTRPSAVYTRFRGNVRPPDKWVKRGEAASEFGVAEMFHVEPQLQRGYLSSVRPESTPGCAEGGEIPV